jgi:putative ABC transport system ATP-binding protein
MEDLAITARGIMFSYRSAKLETPVLRGIDFDVRLGECAFLAGPSGSGKSTLLSILGCILTADAGSLTILGQDVTQLNSKQQARFRRHQIGFVFQRFHLFRGLKAWENIRVPLDLLGYKSSVAKKRAMELLAAVGLADKAHNHISQLSVGQRQRVALARALAADPDLILADEPTAALDASAGLNAMKMLRQVCDQQGKSVVVVTHDNRIFHFADRIFHLEDGRIVRIEEIASREPQPVPT